MTVWPPSLETGRPNHGWRHVRQRDLIDDGHLCFGAHTLSGILGHAESYVTIRMTSLSIVTISETGTVTVYIRVRKKSTWANDTVLIGVEKLI